MTCTYIYWEVQKLLSLFILPLTGNSYKEIILPAFPHAFSWSPLIQLAGLIPLFRLYELVLALAHFGTPWWQME